MTTKIDVNILYNAAKAIRVASSRGAYSMEESAELLQVVTQLEMFVEQINKNSTEDKTSND